MSEYQQEHDRFEQGVLPHDFVDPSPEAVRLRALIDAIGSVVVVMAIDETNEIIETRE
jgi:hypothetical protein